MGNPVTKEPIEAKETSVVKESEVIVEVDEVKTFVEAPEDKAYAKKFGKITRVFSKAANDMDKLIDQMNEEELGIEYHIAYLKDQKRSVLVSKNKAERFRDNLDKLFG